MDDHNCTNPEGFWCNQCDGGKQRELEARVKELEKENELLAQDRQNWKTLANRDFPTELKEANVKLGKENARLRKVVDNLAWFRDRAIKRTVPGIADTTDAVYRLIQDLRKVVDAARVWRAATDKRDEGWADRCFEKWNDLDRALRELDGVPSSHHCECGHLDSAHIYGEGACRPWFQCEYRCEHFKATR